MPHLVVDFLKKHKIKTYIQVLVFSSPFPGNANHISGQVHRQHVNAELLSHQEVTTADAAADIENFLIRPEVKALEELLCSGEATRRDKPSAEDLLVPEHSVSRVLLVVHKLLQGLEALVVLGFAFNEQERKLVVGDRALLGLEESQRFLGLDKH